jgi:bifunctional non-homologous end joining protein LigD
MSKVFDFCIPTRRTQVPSGPDWLHEIKYGGYWLRLARWRSGPAVARNGYDWNQALSLDCRSRAKAPTKASIS